MSQVGYALRYMKETNANLLLEEHQFSSVTQSCLTLCNPMNRSAPGLPVHHQLLEFTQTPSSGWWSLIVLCSLLGPPAVKQLMQIVTMAPGQGRRFQSVCFP